MTSCTSRPEAHGRMFGLLLAAMVAATTIGISQAVAAPPGPPQSSPPGQSSADVLPGRYIVVLKGDAGKPGKGPAAVAKDHGVAPDFLYKSALRGFAGPASAKQAKALAADPRVASVEPDRTVHALAQDLPTGVDRIDADVNSTAAIGDVLVTVAVIDTGIDLDHPDLDVAAGLGMSCASGKKTPDDQNGHGSHVAGSIGALDNSIGVVGVAPGAEVVPVRVLSPNGSGSLSCVIDGIDHVTLKAATIAVANMSLGWQGNSSGTRTAIEGSVAAGVVYTVAAGNEGDDVYGPDGKFGSGDEYEPASYPEVAAISALADSDGTAGGSGANTSYGPDDSFATFSNYSATVVAENPVKSPGKAIDLLLPGVAILSTYKDGGYATISGTSMASPHAAGLAALHIAGNGRATNAAGVAEIRQALIDAGRDQASGKRLLALHLATEPDSNHEPLGWAGSTTTNSSPTAIAASDSTAEDTAVSVTLAGSDVESCELGFSIVSGPANGSLGAIGDEACVAGTPNADTATVTYTPNADFNGADSFVFRVTDGDGAFDEATVSVTVDAVNDAPLAGDVSVSTPEDTEASWTPDVSDVDGDVLTCSIPAEGGPSNGAASVASNCSSGSYTPNPDFNGADSFTYKVSDGSASDTATVSVTVSAVNDAPLAVDDSASTDVDTAVSLNVLSNDSDLDGDSLALDRYDTSSAAGGSVSCELASGECTYAPPSGFSGEDSFTYEATDGALVSNTATVTIGVEAAAPSGFLEDFEGDVSSWTASGYWHLADDTGCTSPSPGYTSATHSAYFGNGSTCSYANRRKQVLGTLTSPSIGVGGSATLSFSSWREVESYAGSAFDRTWVEVSYDGGASWETVWYRDSSDPSLAEWTAESVALSPGGESVRVRFRFDTVDGVANDYRGWLIDDVSVG